MGASDGMALTSFQTPLATGFKFQGWADKFLATPPTPYNRQLNLERSCRGLGSAEGSRGLGLHFASRSLG